MTDLKHDHPGKAYYLQTWATILAGLLEWDEARALQWARETKKDVYLDDPNHMMYEDSPEYYIAGIVMDDLITDSELSHLSRLSLRARVWDILETVSDEMDIGSVPKWEEVRARIRNLPDART